MRWQKHKGEDRIDADGAISLYERYAELFGKHTQHGEAGEGGILTKTKPRVHENECVFSRRDNSWSEGMPLPYVIAASRYLPGSEMKTQLYLREARAHFIDVAWQHSLVLDLLRLDSATDKRQHRRRGGPCCTVSSSRRWRVGYGSRDVSGSVVQDSEEPLVVHLYRPE